MTPFRFSSIALAALIMAGCSEEQPPENNTPTTTLNADDTKAVSLKIPGVDDKTDVSELKTNDDGVITGAIERADVPGVPEAGDSVATVEIPPSLLLTDVISNRFSNTISNTLVPGVLESIFYPLGWSPDGKIAYAVEPPIEAVDAYFVNVYIQDLVTDKILWKDEFREDLPGNQDNKGKIQSFSAYWTAKQSKMGSLFKEHNIKQSNDSVLFAGAISNNDDRIDYVVKKTLKGQPNYGNLAMVTDYEVVVTSEKLGSKTVHKEQYKKFIDVLDVDVIGYLRGEDPSRVALLIAGVRRGYEGPPHVTWYKVVGTSLRVGFKK